MANRRRTWPTMETGRTADYLTPDGFRNSGRSLAGNLRTGTEPRVGPRSGGPIYGDESRTSDMGMDRVSPRGFDPMGTSLEREPGQLSSPLVTVRRRRNE